jgi:phospholipid/cholesterol/gamma-HCH transport system substrate-binding protein
MSLRRARTVRRRRNSATNPVLLGTGVLALLIAVGLLYVAFKAPARIPLKPYYDVTAQFSSLGTLSQEANVSIAGNYVGEAVNLRLINGVPSVDMELNTSTPKLPVDTTARIRPRGLLGAEYIELTPGHSKQTIPDGGIIRATRTSTAEQLSDVLSAFNAPARLHQAQVLNGLGEGLLGRGPQLNEMLASAPGTLHSVVKALGPLLARTGATAQLIAGGNLLLGAFDPVRQDVAEGLRQGANALRPFAQESSHVAQLLNVAPGALRSITASLNATDPTLTHLTTFASNVSGFTALAPNALRSLTNVLKKGRRPLGDLTTVLKRTQPAIAPTLSLTSALNPELPHLTSLFDVLQAPVTLIGRYGCDLEGFAHNWRGFLGLGSKVQSGPLGPYTILRTELAGSGAALPNHPDNTGAGGQSVNVGPCVTPPAGES